MNNWSEDEEYMGQARYSNSEMSEEDQDEEFELIQDDSDEENEDDFDTAPIIDSPQDEVYELMVNDLTVYYVPGNQMQMEKQAFFKVSDGVYHLRRFEDASVSTMTLITFLTGKVHNIREIAHLLPVTMVKDSKLIQPPGTVVSVRLPPLDEDKVGYYPLIRGLNGGVFRNCLFVDVWISSKNKYLSTRLTSSKIQMTGCKTMEMGIEASRHIINLIRETSQFIDDVKSHPKAFHAAWKWIKSQCYRSVRTYQQNNELYEAGFLCFDLKWDHYIERTMPDQRITLSPRVRQFINEIHRRTQDLTYVSQLDLRLAYILDVKSVADPDIDIERVTRSMVNLDHHINSTIDRQYVAERLSELGLNAEFINTQKPHVSVGLLSRCKSEDDLITRRKGKERRQRIRLHSGGKMDHSGLGGRPMHDVYIRFMIKLITIIDSYEAQ